MISPDPLNLVGTTIADKYAVESVVGEGGFAVVYKAMHLLWKRPVAVKVFRALGDFGDEQREKLLSEFLQEGALLADLSERSAAIVQARDVGEVILKGGEKAPYMVLEWLEGATLERVLHTEKAMHAPRRSIPEALRLLEPAAEALALAHAKGIAHRDFKPANVFVLGDPRGEHTVKLLDFGIAKVVQDAQKMAGSFTKTSGQITSFTPQYGAPEQFNRAIGATGPWTDVFSLALVLIEVATGLEGHQGDNMMQMAYAASDPQRRPTPRTLGLHVPDQVEAVFQKALAVRIEDRFQTAGAFWNALRVTHNLEPMRSVTTDRSSAIRAALAPTDSAPTMVQPHGPPTTQPTSSSAGVGLPPPSASSGGSSAAVIALAIVGALAVGGVAAFFGVRGLKGAGPTSSTTAAPTAPPSGLASAVPSAVPAPTSCPRGMIFVPGGTFYMGAEDAEADDDEKPPHKVKLSPFCIDKTEVTVAAYAQCTKDGACLRAGEQNIDKDLPKAQLGIYDSVCNIRQLDDAGAFVKANHPINCVDWNQAQNFCRVQGGRLPTEAEWEFAARGKDGRRYPWGDAPPAVGHFNACGKECADWGKKRGLKLEALFPKETDGWDTTANVGSFPEGKSAYGLDDMVGNVYEWVADWYGEYPKSRDDLVENPTGPDKGEKRVVRGGAWNGFDIHMVRPTYRYTGLPEKRSHGYGFRCAASPK